MKYATKTTASGLKVYFGGKHIKTIPSKFESVVNRITFADTGTKRPSNADRIFMEGELMKDDFSKRPAPDKYVYERIKNAIAIDYVEVKKRCGESRYVLVFDNGIEISCGASLSFKGQKNTKNSLY